MERDADDYACLLDSIDAVEAARARSLLAGVGIPCLVDPGEEFEHLELGSSGSVSVHVPGPLLEDARFVLRTAWGADAPGASSLE